MRTKIFTLLNVVPSYALARPPTVRLTGDVDGSIEIVNEPESVSPTSSVITMVTRHDNHLAAPRPGVSRKG